MPGPVTIHPDVAAALASTPISQRSESFREHFKKTQRILCDLVNAKRVEIITGSGTLANEMIAAQLSLLPGLGLILSSSEFSSRLVGIARRLQLDFIALEKEWGSLYDFDKLDQVIESHNIAWIWTTHCETSTGYLVDIAMLQTLCAKHDLELCLDCIYSIGTVPLDLSGVYLASASSGKALGSYASLAMVFYNHDLAPDSRLPSYLDLGYYQSKDGIPFTISSCLVYALKKAAELAARFQDYDKLKTYSAMLRKSLNARGIPVSIDEIHCSPAVLTLPIPDNISSFTLGHQLKLQGYLLSYESGYHINHNHIQICLMSHGRM